MLTDLHQVLYELELREIHFLQNQTDDFDFVKIAHFSFWTSRDLAYSYLKTCFDLTKISWKVFDFTKNM